MDFFPLWGFLPILCLTAWWDLTRMRIPNALVLTGLAIFFASAPFLDVNEFLFRFSAGLIALVVCFILYAFSILGGGDAKMMPVMFLFVPTSFLTVYLFGFALAMTLGMIGVFFARHEFGSETTAWVSMRPKAHFPMGVSIALSGLLLAVSPHFL